ncbi:MAG TPA: TetR/AcrR family transcriptional regulator [Stellaceae bacterium]|nr:TetR/AcrR family transcriptional regulator [Stellaceae bacterium]
MPTALKQPADPRIDPRVERSRQVILAAALAELGESGYGGFTIESVAARAGAGKSTIYRHWPDKLSLIADAFETLHQQGGPDLSSSSARAKLTRILAHVAEVLIDSPFSTCLPAMIEAAQRDEALRDFHYRFQSEARKPTVALIAAGIASGEFPADRDPELSAQALLGALFFRRLMTDTCFAPDEAGALVDTVMGRAAAG